MNQREDKPLPQTDFSGSATVRPAGDGDSPPASERPLIPSPRDEPHPGQLTLAVDASDTTRGIIRGRMSIPVRQPGPMTLFYPQWMPGYHSPQNPIELFAGLEIRAGGLQLDWRRDPVEVYAFHLDVPEGTDALDISFQFLSPTAESQGDVVVTDDLLNIQWGRVLLYPAGYFARQIEVVPSVTLPAGWSFTTALEAAGREGASVQFKPVSLDVLVDSPVMAGRHSSDIELDNSGTVRMSLFGHDPASLDASHEHLQSHCNLATQADKLFASRHFDRYRFLVALSEELGGGGVEHHRSAEIVLPSKYFTEWDRHLSKRDVFAHEFTHSWNGKFRRGSDSWTPSFEVPIRSSLMWLYEGQTQYWGQVLTARAGLWSTETALQTLAKTAATYDIRPGSLWRTMADTTRDPIIAGRAPLPWPSWQRSEDYYAEGLLLWLSIDTLIRERSGDQRSLDDFARSFFGMDEGSMETRTYDFEEIIGALNSIVRNDWTSLINDALHRRDGEAPLEGLDRGGYRLVYRDYRNDFCKSFDALAGQFDMRFSIGLIIGGDGTIQEVMWDSPAFNAGLTAGALILKVNGQPYSEQLIGDAIEAAQTGTELRLEVRARPESRPREVIVDYREGHRFPHLEPLEGQRRRLDEIFKAL